MWHRFRHTPVTEAVEAVGVVKAKTPTGHKKEMALGVFDFKFTCPGTNEARWGVR